MGSAAGPGLRGPSMLNSRDGRQQSSMHEGEAHKDIFGDVPLAKRVKNWIEKTDAGMEIDVASALLSVVTVVTYMAETYYPEDSPTYTRLKAFDLSLSVLFAAEWIFWFWLSRDKVRYVFSYQSLVDVITVLPIFVSYFISAKVPGFATFEALIRILRVLRVFRVFRLGRRLRSEVQARMLTLIFTLLAIIVTSAGLFYEIETRYGERYPDLRMSQAIYWSVVTTTTIGYGDISPSLIGSQVTLIAMLFITFAVLPYQTSALASALSYTSVYTTARYSRRARGRHVVVTGHLTVPTMTLLVEELYHEDYGFQDFNCVFLSPQNPDDDMRRLLKTHKQSHRMLYLQGSPMSHEDLARAQVDRADAVLIMCNKTPSDAREEDLRNVMTCLAVGQYNQMIGRASSVPGMPTLSGWLMRCFSRGLDKIQKGKSGVTGMPFMCIQLLLPESQQRLNTLLDTYAANQGCIMHPAGAPAAPDDAADSRQQRYKRRGSQPVEPINSKESGVPLQSATSSGLARSHPCSISSGSLFWQEFRLSITVISVTEIRYSLLGQSLLSCPGAITLLCNLVRSVDEGTMLKAELEQLPQWFKEYLDGSGNELYEVTSFPEHMHGESLSVVAMYLQDAFQAIVVAASGSTAQSELLQSTATPTATQLGDTAVRAGAVNVPAGAPEQSASGMSTCSSSGSGIAPIILAPLHQKITASTSAFVIASDVRVVMEIMGSTELDYHTWKAQHTTWDASCQTAVHSIGRGPKQQHTLQNWALQSDSIKQEAALHDALDSGSVVISSDGHQQHMLQQIAGSYAAEVQSAGASVPVQQQLQQSIEAPAGLHPLSPAKQSSSRSSRRVASEGGRPLTADTYSTSPEPERRKTAEMFSTSNNGGSRNPSAVAALQGISARSLASSQDGSKRRQRGSIQVNTRPGPAGLRNFKDVVAAALGARENAARQRLSGASRRGRELASQRFQQLYHTRQPPNPGDDIVAAMVQDEVNLTGHILVCASCTPPSALRSLLAPLRSSCLSAICPVVILDTAQPSGSEWAAVARFAELYYVQGSVHDPDALNRAHAEAAASAVLLLPWAGQSSNSGQQDNSPEMMDAYVMAANRSLRALNPVMQVFCELNLYQSLAFLDPTGSMLDWRSDKAAAAAATPAYISGSVLLPVMVDTMVCQAMYNHGTPRMITQLLTQWHSRPGTQLHTAAMQSSAMQLPPSNSNSALVYSGSDSAAASNNVAAEDMLPAATNSSTAAMIERLEASTPVGLSKPTLAAMQPASADAVLLQIPTVDCPSDTFGELFEQLLTEQCMICCGLYRSAVHEGRRLWYVMTNPDKDTPLREDDRAFVLVPQISGRELITM